MIQSAIHAPPTTLRVVFHRENRGSTSAVQADILPRAHTVGKCLPGSDDRDHEGLARRALRDRDNGIDSPSLRPKETGSTATPRRDVGLQAMHEQEKGGQRHRGNGEARNGGTSDVAGACEDDVSPPCLDSHGQEEGIPHNPSVQASRVTPDAGAAVAKTDDDDSDTEIILDRSSPRSYESKPQVTATPEVKGGPHYGDTGGGGGRGNGDIASAKFNRTQPSSAAERSTPRPRHSWNIDPTVDIRRDGSDEWERREPMRTVMEEDGGFSPGPEKYEAGRGEVEDDDAIGLGGRGSGDDDDEDTAGLKIECGSVEASTPRSYGKSREEIRTRVRARGDRLAETVSGASPGVGRGQGSSPMRESTTGVSNGLGVEFGNSGVWEHVQGEGAVLSAALFRVFHAPSRVFVLVRQSTACLYGWCPGYHCSGWSTSLALQVRREK